MLTTIFEVNGDVSFLQRFIAVKWAGIRKDLGTYGSRQRPFGPAFAACGAGYPEPIRYTTEPSTTLREGLGLTFKRPANETEREHLPFSAAVFGQPVTLSYGGESGRVVSRGMNH